MKDKDLQQLMNKTINAKNKYYELLDVLEKEYEERFGKNPSEIDDDYFIDTFHQRQGNRMTVEQLTKHAKRIW